MTDSLPILLVVLALAAMGAALWFAVRSAGVEPIRAERDRAVAELTALRQENTRLAADLAAAKATDTTRVEEAANREKALRDLKGEFEKTFQLVATQTLDASQQRYLAAAQGSVKEVVTPAQEALSKLAAQVEALEKSRTKDKATLEEQMSVIGKTLKDTQNVTGKLAQALRQSPKARGRWGEHSLRNALEMGGLTPKVDFDEQATVDADGGKLRPDVVIKLPGARTIVVDSKVAISAFLDAIEAADESARDLLMQKHASELRAHMKGLTAKEYWRHFETADFVVMFVPGDNLVTSAFELDPTLQEDAFKQRVIIASPTMMVALARTVAYGWRQERSAQSVQEIADLGRELYRRLGAMWTHLGDVGKALGGSVDKYNLLIGSLDRSVMPQARRFRELGAAEGTEIQHPPQIDATPRAMPTPPEQLDLIPPPPSAKRGR